MPDYAQTPLTNLCSTGGCAAKFDAPLLHRLLQNLAPADSPDLLVGLNPADDAAVFRITDEIALIFTVDFFPPVVDDPHTYGKISANNALNDIYAMGGRPLLGLSVAAFPMDLAPESISAVLQGASDACNEAGAVLAGGHTIRDNEPKFGLAVAGVVESQNFWLKGGAQPGDDLFLTKPLGVGLIVTGNRHGRVSPAEIEEAIDLMLISNRTTTDILREFAPTAVTDVTGSGLLGHAREIADASGVRLVFHSDSLPVLDAATRVAREGLRTSAHEGNHLLVADALEVGSRVNASLLAVALDPQTAGGLLVSVPSSASNAMTLAFQRANLFCVKIGQAESGAGVVLA